MLGRAFGAGCRILAELRALFDSSRPSEDTVRDSFRRLSCTRPGAAAAAGTGTGVWFARMFCLEERLRVRDRWLRDRNRPGELLSGVELDRALRASVSKVDSQSRGSRERPNTRSFSLAGVRVDAGVAGRIALWLLRRLPLAT